MLALVAGCAAPTTDAATSESPRSESVAPNPVTTPAPTPEPVRDPRQDPRLLAAARRGDLDAVRSAIAAGASVKAKDSQGRTALVIAAYNDDYDVSKLLLASGANPNTKDQTTQSAYLISTSEVGDDPKLLNLMLSNGARINSKDRFNGTGLIRAADRGFPRISERLIEAGIDKNHVNNLGWTALHEAIVLGDGSRKYRQTVRVLVAGGVDVNIVSQRDNKTALTLAEDRGYTEIARILRNAGAHS